MLEANLENVLIFIQEHLEYCRAHLYVGGANIGRCVNMFIDKFTRIYSNSITQIFGLLSYISDPPKLYHICRSYHHCWVRLIIGNICHDLNVAPVSFVGEWTETYVTNKFKVSKYIMTETTDKGYKQPDVCETVSDNIYSVFFSENNKIL